MTSYVAAMLQVTLQCESGMHIGTGFGMAKLLDERTTQGPHPHTASSVEVPYVPGSTLKGRLRAKATELAEALELTERDVMLRDMFGTDVLESGCAAGRLVFEDAHLSQADAAVLTRDEGALRPYLALERRAHVALSRVRRSAREHMLMTLEVASSGFTLETRIQGWLPAAQAEREVALLVLAIRTTTHLGGHKGRGLGAVQLATGSIRIDSREVSLEQLKESL